MTVSFVAAGVRELQQDRDTWTNEKKYREYGTTDPCCKDVIILPLEVVLRKGKAFDNHELRVKPLPNQLSRHCSSPTSQESKESSRESRVKSD